MPRKTSRGPQHGRGRPGRPPVDEETPIELYISTFRAAQGNYWATAEALGVRWETVKYHHDKNPEMQRIRQEAREARCEMAQNVVVECLHDKQIDINTRLRASIFTLNTESPAHAQQVANNVSGNLQLTLPVVQVNFIGPGGKEPSE